MMRVMLSILTGIAVLGNAPTAGAQQKSTTREPTKTAAPERDGCVTRDGKTVCEFRRTNLDSTMMNRPALGVQLGPTGTARDTLGVFVTRVTPKGPAENAGVVEGDRIVSINGVDLRVDAADAGDGYAAELPARRLTREVAKLKPGSVAALRVYSGGRIRDVQVTVGRASDLRESGLFGLMPDGLPRAGAALRISPNLDGLRMQLRDMPRMRPEDMDGMRMQLDGLRDRIRVEHLAPLMDGEHFRVMAAPRIRILRDGESCDTIITGLEKTKVEKEKAKSGGKDKGK